MTFRPKVGLISCSGEACAGGKLSRAATLEVLHHLRPTDTVTICLPLFLAGDEGERGFANVFPTITIDGCNKLCAAKGTTTYSSEPAVKVNIQNYTNEDCNASDDKIEKDKRDSIIKRVVDELAVHVDRLRDEWV